MAPRRAPVRWVEEAEDPELEARLIRELEHRRIARRVEHERRRRERRAGAAFWLVTLVALALAAAIAYGAFEIARALFGA
jgi:hypothetical protein